MRKDEEREMKYALGFNVIGRNHGYTNKNLVAYLESVFGKTTTLDVGYYGRVFCWFVLFKRNEKEIFEKALKIVYEDLNEYFDNGLFPMWVFEKDILIDFKDKYGGLANLYFNNDNYKKVGKNVQLVSFNTNIVVDVYDFMDCIYDHIPVFITYDLLIREGKYFFVIKKYLKYINRMYLYNILTNIRETCYIDKDISIKIAETIYKFIPNFYQRRADSDTKELDVVTNMIYSILEKNNCKIDIKVLEFENLNDISYNDLKDCTTAIKQPYFDEKKKINIVDIVATINSDNTITYTFKDLTFSEKRMLNYIFDNKNIINILKQKFYNNSFNSTLIYLDTIRNYKVFCFNDNIEILFYYTKDDSTVKISEIKI